MSGAGTTGRLRRCLALAWLALACPCGGPEHAGSGDPATGAGGASDSVRRQAADRGIDWMQRHWREMPPGWVTPFFVRLYRVVEDDDRAERLWSIVEEEATSRRRSLPDDLGDRRYLDDRFLRPVLREIRRRRLVGEPYREHAARIERLVRDNEEAFWSRRRLTQKIVYLDLFDEAGITTGRSFQDLLEEARAAADLDSERPEPGYVYALTHLVLYESGYFARHPDPEPLEFSVPVLRDALDAYLAQPPRGAPLDLQAEILICLQLLRVPPDDRMDRGYARLLDAQNRDGGWGSGPASSGRRVHLTFTASVALLGLPQRFRQLPELGSRRSVEPAPPGHSGRQPGSDSPSSAGSERLASSSDT